MKKNTYNAIVSYVEIDNPNEGLLSGWDVALKDNINMRDTKTTAGSKMLENYTSIYNATVVDHLIAQGANIVAKTSMDEFGMGSYNFTALTGSVKNPHDPHRITGGSSGGSAALVAAKHVRMALGTDTGDSIRKPASYCGVVGFKPTYGLISRYGVIPYAGSLDHVGVFTQNVKDAALSLEVLSKKDPKDMTTHDIFKPYSALLDMDLKGKKVGIFKNVIDVITDEDVKTVFNNLVKTLEREGAIIVEKSIDQTLTHTLFPVYSIISNAEAITHHANLDGVRFGLQVEGDTLEALMTNSRSAGFGLQVKERFIYGAYVLENGNQFDIYDKARKVRRLLVESYTEMLADVDVMIAPAATQIAPLMKDINHDPKTNDMYFAENHMVIHNFSGYPSMTIPMGTSNEMPLGVNISAKAFEDDVVLAFANQVEKLVEGEI